MDDYFANKNKHKLIIKSKHKYIVIYYKNRLKKCVILIKSLISWIIGRKINL